MTIVIKRNYHIASISQAAAVFYEYVFFRFVVLISFTVPEVISTLLKENLWFT